MTGQDVSCSYHKHSRTPHSNPHRSCQLEPSHTRICGLVMTLWYALSHADVKVKQGHIHAPLSVSACPTANKETGDTQSRDQGSAWLVGGITSGNDRCV